jgi:hypothetical protein
VKAAAAALVLSALATARIASAGAIDLRARQRCDGWSVTASVVADTEIVRLDVRRRGESLHYDFARVSGAREAAKVSHFRGAL